MMRTLEERLSATIKPFLEMKTKKEDEKEPYWDQRTRGAKEWTRLTKSIDELDELRDMAREVGISEKFRQMVVNVIGADKIKNISRENPPTIDQIYQLTVNAHKLIPAITKAKESFEGTIEPPTDQKAKEAYEFIIETGQTLGKWRKKMGGSELLAYPKSLKDLITLNNQIDINQTINAIPEKNNHLKISKDMRLTDRWNALKTTLEKLSDETAGGKYLQFLVKLNKSIAAVIKYYGEDRSDAQIIYMAGLYATHIVAMKLSLMREHKSKQ